MLSLSQRFSCENTPQILRICADFILQNGITHAFVVEFESIEDRDYYVNDDPTHDEFKKLAGKVLEKAQVIDFIDGVFEL